MDNKERKKVTVYLPKEVVKLIDVMQDALQDNSDDYVERSKIVESALRFFYSKKFNSNAGGR